MFSCPVVLLLQQVLPLTRSFSWSLAASKGSEVSDNDIHALKSIGGRLADKEAHSVVPSGNCTEPPYSACSSYNHKYD